MALTNASKPNQAAMREARRARRQYQPEPATPPLKQDLQPPSVHPGLNLAINTASMPKPWRRQQIFWILYELHHPQAMTFADFRQHTDAKTPAPAEITSYPDYAQQIQPPA